MAQSIQKVKQISGLASSSAPGDAKKHQVAVAIWSLDVSAKRRAELYNVLTPNERAKADGLQRPIVAQRFVVSRAVARELLALHCGCAPGDISLSTSASGKPHISHPPSGIAFNVSHSVGFGALALGQVDNVGLDIEALRPSVDDLAESVFALGEAAQFAALPGPTQARALFRAWVAKEAYLKATGEGLSGGLDSLELDLTTSADIRPLAIRGTRVSLSRWQFFGFDVSEKVVGAVAIEAGGPIDVRIRRLDAEHSLTCRPPVTFSANTTSQNTSLEPLCPMGVSV